MPFNVEKKFLYIHIPRTGGHSLKQAIYDAGLDLEGFKNKHDTPKEIRKYMSDWKDYWKFAFIRNPFDRLVSQYSHRVKNLKSRGFRKYKGFKAWLKAYAKKGKIRSQIRMLEGEMDFIGTVENMYEDYDKVCKHLKIKNCLSGDKLNSATHRHYREYYDSETRNIVEWYCMEDVDWGCKF